MDPQQQFCHNEGCRAYGRKGEGHIVIHSQKERRYRCKRCGRTFTQTKGSALYRIHNPKWLVVAVVTLLAYGCPLRAIVAAFDLDERTVARWQREAALQCKRVHEHTVEAGRVRLLQVQADEIRVKAVGGIYWLASALEVRSRLWLGGVIGHSRDRHLIRSLLIRVCSCGPVEGILLVTDGLSSYASQALHVFREPLHTGRRGRPRLVLARGVMVAQVIKRHERRRVVEVLRRVVVGAEAEVISRVIATQRSIRALINTSYIERLNATFRARVAPLVRRTRAGAHKQCTLEWGMWLVGGCYNFMWAHRSLGAELTTTPAMAAGLTDHRWTMEELLAFPVAPAELPRWRGRKPRWLLEIECAA
jgi:transposase-like protein